jgi:hypothetical protein
MTLQGRVVFVLIIGAFALGMGTEMIWERSTLGQFYIRQQRASFIKEYKERIARLEALQSEGG